MRAVTLTYGSLFSGIGGLDLGAEAAGFEGRWQVELDDWCRARLAQRWPDVDQHGDVSLVDPAQLAPVDLIVGGFPCQPISVAGKGLAQADERWLWPDYLRLAAALQPSYVLVENVRNLLRVNDGSAMGEVLAGLAATGYDAAWDVIGADAVGAPHQRDRLFIRAWRHHGQPLATHPVAVLGDSGEWVSPGAGLWSSTAPYAEEWPASGSMVSGTAWARQQRLYGGGTASRGRMWPTPNAGMDRHSTNDAYWQNRVAKGRQVDLQMAVYLATGSAALNPAWVEWLMGLPIGWTDPAVADPQPHPGWAVDPADDGRVPRLLDDVPARQRRLKACGNAVVPAVAYVAALDLLAA